MYFKWCETHVLRQLYLVLCKIARPGQRGNKYVIGLAAADLFESTQTNYLFI